MEHFTRLETLAQAACIKQPPMTSHDLPDMLDGLPEYAANVFDGQIDRIAPGLESLILLNDFRWRTVIVSAIVHHGAQAVCLHLWDGIRDHETA